MTHIDHISMGAENAREQQALLERLLGFKFLHEFPAHEASGFGGCTSQVRGTEMEFEVIEPSGPGSFVRRFLDEGGPGLHHIAVETSSIDATVEEMKKLGLTPFGGVSDDGQWRFTFIHPKESGGILWQPFEWTGRPQEMDRNAGGGAVGLVRMDHVSMAVPDADKQVEWQARVFGMELKGSWTDEHLGYHGRIMSIPGSKLEFEIVSPSREGSFIQRFIDERRPGMHHICCEVESVEAAAAGLRKQGIEPFGGIIDNGWKKHTFIHPRDSGGVLFQLFEERD